MFTVTNGTENLIEYRFNTQKIAHLFCATCGVQTFGFGEGEDGVKMAALNVRTIDNFNLSTLEIQALNGKDF